MVRGQEILEQHFPGLSDELLARGALPIDASRDVAFFVAGDWHKPTRHADTLALAMSRAWLETTVYQRVVANPRVQIKHAHEVVSISTDVNAASDGAGGSRSRWFAIHPNAVER
jgi:hypothetical protein